MVCCGGGTCWWSSSPSYNLFACCPIGFLQALASGALLSCSGKKVSKEAGLRGEQLAPARIVPPLRIPREEPTGIDPSLWLGCGVSAFAPVFVCGFMGCFFPTLSIENRMRSPVQIVRRTKKAPIPNGIEAFLELLARFELAAGFPQNRFCGNP